MFLVGTEEESEPDTKPSTGRMDHMKDALEKAMKDLNNEEDILSKRGLSREELKERLKKYKAEKDDVQNPEVSKKFASFNQYYLVSLQIT